jgi:hypothetical protein
LADSLGFSAHIGYLLVKEFLCLCDGLFGFGANLINLLFRGNHFSLITSNYAHEALILEKKDREGDEQSHAYYGKENSH